MQPWFLHSVLTVRSVRCINSVNSDFCLLYTIYIKQQYPPHKNHCPCPL